MVKLLVLFLSCLLHLLNTHSVDICNAEEGFTCFEGINTCRLYKRKPKRARLPKLCEHSGIHLKAEPDSWNLGCESWDFGGQTIPKWSTQERRCPPKQELYNDYCDPMTDSNCVLCVDNGNLRICTPGGPKTNPPDTPETSSTAGERLFKEMGELPRQEEPLPQENTGSSNDWVLVVCIALPIVIGILILVICLVVRLRKGKSKKKPRKKGKSKNKKKKTTTKSLTQSESELSTSRTALSSIRSAFRVPSTLLPKSPPKQSERLDESPSAENAKDDSVFRSDFSSIKSQPKQKGAGKKSEKKKGKKNDDQEQQSARDTDLTNNSTVSQR